LDGMRVHVAAELKPSTRRRCQRECGGCRWESKGSNKDAKARVEEEAYTPSHPP
jgi:hypothetical protein